MKEDFPREILLHLLEGIRSEPHVLSTVSGQNTLPPRKAFFVTYTPPRKTDRIFFTACGRELCETFNELRIFLWSEDPGLTENA